MDAPPVVLLPEAVLVGYKNNGRRIMEDKFPHSSALMGRILAWHGKHFGDVAWDKGEVFFPTMLLTLLISSPVWGSVMVVEAISTKLRR
jgi:hypothetical protein